MNPIIGLALLLASIGMIAAILLQSRGAGLGATFGGESSVYRSRRGVDFDSMDGRPAHLFFLLVAPEASVGVHLKTLARISKLLKSTEVRQRLLEAPQAEAIYRIIAEEEDKLL